MVGIRSRRQFNRYPVLLPHAMSFRDMGYRVYDSGAKHKVKQWFELAHRIYSAAIGTGDGDSSSRNNSALRAWAFLSFSSLI